MASKKKKKPDKKTQKPAPAKVRPPRLYDDLAFRYKLLIAVVALIVALGVLYPDAVFQNKVFVGGDTQAAQSFAKPILDAMAEGEKDPQWNPYLFSGMPSYGSLSYNPKAYPVSLFTGFLVRYLHFPNLTWMLFHMFLLGLGVFLLLVDRGVHWLVAIGAGIVMMWMPNYVAVGVHGHGSQSNAVGYMPFALWLWDRMWRGKGVVFSGSALVILLGFQLLRAHIQISYYTFMLIGLHLVFFGALKIRDAFRGKAGEGGGGILRFFYKDGAPTKRTALLEVASFAVILGIIAMGAVGVSAVLLLPVQDYAPHSIRGSGEGGGVTYDYATSWSLHPTEALTFVFPFAFGWGKATYVGHMPFTDYPNYIGVIVFLFAVFAIVRVKTRFVRFLAFVAVVTTLVSFGKYFPILYNPMFYWLPYFNKFRVPVMVLIVQQLAVVLMSGFGLAAFVRLGADDARRVVKWVAVAAAATLLVAVVSAGYWTGGFAESIASRITRVQNVEQQLALANMAGVWLRNDLFKIAVLLILATAAMWLYAGRKLPAMAFMAFILVMAAADLYAIDRHILHPKTLHPWEPGVIADKTTRNLFMERDGLIEFLERDDDLYRVFPMYHPQEPLRFADFQSNRYMNFGIASIGGYNPAKLTIYNDFLQALGAALQIGNFQLVNMLNVRYLILGNPFPEQSRYELVWQGKDYEGADKFVYQNPLALPRAFVVDRYQVAAPDDILRAMAGSKDADYSQVVLLEKEPGLGEMSAEGADVRVVDYGFNEIRVDAKLTAPAILVLSEIYYPRWKVLVDGRPAELLKANYILRAVALAEGEHEVVFRYDGSLLAKARAISLTTFVLAFVLWLVSGFLMIKGRFRGSAHNSAHV